MEYNTDRKNLIIPEYGRNVQKMVEHATDIKDNDERQRCVDSIIKFMGQMNPHLRDVKEFNHKIWDHLYIMSDLKIDVQSPYPIPKVKELEAKPNKINYINRKIKFSFYGATIQNMIEIAINMKEGEEKNKLIGMTANHMKKSYLLFNKDSVEDKTITLHLETLSDKKLSLPEGFQYIDAQSIIRNKRQNHRRKFKKRK